MANEAAAPGTITDRITAAAEEAHLKVKAKDDKKGAKTEAAPEPTDPKARVEGLFSAVTTELSGAGADLDKLRELQAALQSQAGLITRAVEAAIEDIIAKVQAEQAEKAAAEPPPEPAKAAPASASPSAHAGAKANEAPAKK